MIGGCTRTLSTVIEHAYHMTASCAAAMLKARHAAERLQGAWHGGLSSIDQLRGRMQDCLAEFAVSRDEAEVPPRWHQPLWFLTACMCG